MNRRLPPNLYERQYKTRSGYTRTLWVPRFKDRKGKRRTFPGIPDFKEACRELSRLQALNREGHDFDMPEVPEIVEVTLFGWIEKLLKILAHKPIAERHKYSATHLKGFFGDAPLDSISNIRMLEYRGHRTREGVTVATINRELALLKQIFNAARSEGDLRVLPEVPFEKEDNERLRVASDIEYRRILRELNADSRDFCIIMREMGFRPKDILRITPADVDFSGRSLNMRRIRSKHGHKRPLPMSPGVWGIISRRAKGKPPNELLFNFTRGQVGKSFERACAKLNINGLWLYDLKASFITEKLRDGWPQKIVMEFTGNRSASSFARYSRPSDEDLKEFIGAAPKRKKTVGQRNGSNHLFRIHEGR